MAIFVRITGDMAPIEARAAELAAAIDASPTSRFAAIRDPLRYIIIPMLQPREVLYTCGKYIGEFGGRYYSKTHHSSLHIETLGGRMIHYRDGQLLAPRFGRGQMHRTAPAKAVATEVATFDIAARQWIICDTMDDPSVPVLIGTPL